MIRPCELYREVLGNAHFPKRLCERFTLSCSEMKNVWQSVSKKTRRILSNRLPRRKLLAVTYQKQIRAFVKKHKKRKRLEAKATSQNLKFKITQYVYALYKKIVPTRHFLHDGNLIPNQSHDIYQTDLA